ncbi:MAG: rod shape-determining protein MreD [Bacteroides sp.]|nr:rod shape-determining protein MreD [Bacteroides sp.]
MLVNYLNRLGWFLGLLLLQALILNHVHLWGVATPFLYIYLLLTLESDTSPGTLMLWAFFLGLAVDTFSDTPGMNAASAVLLAFVRPYCLRLFMPRDSVDTIRPSLRTLGMLPFLKYAAVCVLIHHTMLMLMEFFSLLHAGLLLLHILACSLLTLACIMAVEGIRKH